MIEYRDDPDTNIIEITIDGDLSDAESAKITAQLEAAITRHGKVLLLKEIKSIGTIEPATFWSNLKFSLRHLNDISRCAVVSDKVWVEWLTKAGNPLLACEVRHFEPDQIEGARAWLRPPA